MSKRVLLNRQGFIAFIRAMACLFIILLHVVSTWTDDGIYKQEFFEIWDMRRLFDWIFVSIAVRWCVPAFFMISGILLLNPYKEIKKEKYFNYVKRMALTLLSFGYIYCLLETFINTRTVNIQIFCKAFIELLEGKSWAHMWFVYIILGIYLILPCLRIFVANASERMLQYTVVLMFFVYIAIPTINKLCGIELTNLGLSTVSGALFYFITGYALVYTNWGGLNKRYVIICILIGIMIFAYLQWYGFWVMTDYVSPEYIWIAMYSCGLVWICAHSSKIDQIGNNPMIRRISDYSFGIYLVHMVFINILYKGLHLYPDRFPPIAGDLGIWLGAVIFSIGSCWVLKKIPVVRNII